MAKGFQLVWWTEMALQRCKNFYDQGKVRACRPEWETGEQRRFTGRWGKSKQDLSLSPVGCCYDSPTMQNIIPSL